MPDNRGKLTAGLHMLKAFGFKPGQKEVILALCQCKSVNEMQFIKESVAHYVDYLLDNPDDMTEDMINRLRAVFEKA